MKSLFKFHETLYTGVFQDGDYDSKLKLNTKTKWWVQYGG